MLPEKVNVLLSTYNGAQYLDKQLESLYEQNSINLVLTVRDDGSTDETLRILDSWRTRIPMTVIHGKNCGPAASFIHLIQQTSLSSDYYAFCDQDDWWYPDKLLRAVQMLSERKDNRPPRLYCSSTIISDSDLNSLGHSRVPEKPVKLENVLVENVATGCTVVMNKPLLELMRSKPVDSGDIVMHDWWALLVASAFGEVVYDKKSFILYRQHGGNEVGYQKGLSFWKSRLKRFNSGKESKRISRQVKHFYELYKDELDVKYSTLIKQCFFSTQGFRAAISCVGDGELYRQRWIDTWILRVLFLLNKV